jgi:hypothetical protein
VLGCYALLRYAAVTGTRAEQVVRVDGTRRTHTRPRSRACARTRGRRCGCTGGRSRILGITGALLWTVSPSEKNLEKTRRKALCGARTASRTTASHGTKIGRGKPRQASGVGKPASQVDRSDRRSVRQRGPAEQSAGGAAGPAEAPPSHTWRGLAHSRPYRWRIPANNAPRRVARRSPRSVYRTGSTPAGTWRSLQVNAHRQTRAQPRPHRAPRRAR